MASVSKLPPPPHDLLDGASLFLDFDGTLVELVARHDDVFVDHRLRTLLASLRTRLGGRVAIISGRSTGDLRALFGSPEFAIAGSHGLELHWPDGRRAHPPPTDWRPLVSELRALSARISGVVVEEKPFGAALHYRLAPHAEQQCRELVERLAVEHGLGVQSGKMVVELKPRDANKGSALALLMNDPPMRGSRPIFIGDDETDEAGFEAAVRLGGAGVLVGKPRVSTAAYGLAGVSETLRWLEAAGG